MPDDDSMELKHLAGGDIFYSVLFDCSMSLVFNTEILLDLTFIGLCIVTVFFQVQPTRCSAIQYNALHHILQQIMPIVIQGFSSDSVHKICM
jgi:hypothetical protein